jgi:hypothetical protein
MLKRCIQKFFKGFLGLCLAKFTKSFISLTAALCSNQTKHIFHSDGKEDESTEYSNYIPKKKRNYFH